MKTTAFSVVAVATSFALLSGCASTPNESASVDNDSMAQQYEASGPQGQAQATPQNHTARSQTRASALTSQMSHLSSLKETVS